MKKVSLYLDDDLWHCLRLGCVQRQTSASAQVSQLVTDLLARWQQDTPDLPPFGTAGRPTKHPTRERTSP